MGEKRIIVAGSNPSNMPSSGVNRVASRRHLPLPLCASLWTTTAWYVRVAGDAVLDLPYGKDKDGTECLPSRMSFFMLRER